MRLRATRAIRIRIRRLDLDVEIDRDEEMRTEISAKFRRERLTAELTAAGFRPAWLVDRRAGMVFGLAVGIV